MNNLKVIIESSNNGYIARIENDPFNAVLAVANNISGIKESLIDRLIEHQILYYSGEKKPDYMNGRLKINFVLRECLPSRQYTERPFGSMMLFFNTEIVDFGVCKQSILQPGMRDDAGFIVTCTFMGDNSFYGFIADKSYKYYAEAQDVADKMKFGELPPPRFVRITNNGFVFLRHCMAEQDETMPAIPVAQ